MIVDKSIGQNSHIAIQRDKEEYYSDEARSKRARIARMLTRQEKAYQAEKRYNNMNICCNIVLPATGICDICGKVHKIKY